MSLSLEQQFIQGKPMGYNAPPFREEVKPMSTINLDFLFSDETATTEQGALDQIVANLDTIETATLIATDDALSRDDHESLRRVVELNAAGVQMLAEALRVATR